MNELTTEIIAALAQKQDLDEVFRRHLEIAINHLKCFIIVSKQSNDCEALFVWSNIIPS